MVEAVLFKLTDIDTQGQPADVSKKYLQDLFITDPTMDRARLITSKGEIENGMMVQLLYMLLRKARRSML